MLVDGKVIARYLENDLKTRFQTLTSKKVCFVMFGEDAASLQFVGMKTRMAERLGVHAKIQQFPETFSTSQAAKAVGQAASEGCAIVVQLPLPAHMDTQIVLNCVPAELDIDVLSEKAKEQFASGDSSMTPPVARAVFKILDFCNVSFEGKNVLMVGQGKLVGEPVASLLSLKNIPFKTVDKNTPEEERLRHLQAADIIISGVGSPHFIKPEMIKSGAVLIDAGTSEQAGKLAGDVDPLCGERASLITPVPGGVGPVTVACLFENLSQYRA